MENREKFTVKTRSGRNSIEQYPNLNFESRKVNQREKPVKKKENMLRDEHLEELERQRSRQQEEDGRRQAEENRTPRRRTENIEAGRQGQNETSEIDELARLRADLEQRRIQLEQREREIQQRLNVQGDVNEPRNILADSLSSLINNIQYNNAEIRMPRFLNEAKTNPKDFLEQMEKYFRFKNIQNDARKLIFIESALDGRAQTWMNFRRENIVTFEQFKQEFLAEFYSIPVKVKLESNWHARRYNSHDGSMQDYFYSQLKEASYFENNESTYRINYNIVQQLPFRIKQNLATVDFSSTSAVAQALAQFDHFYNEYENSNHNNYSNNRRFQNNNTNNDQTAHVRQLNYDNNYRHNRQYNNNRKYRQNTYNPQYQNNHTYRHNNTYRNNNNRNNTQHNIPNSTQPPINFGNNTVPNLSYPPPNFQTQRSNETNIQPLNGQSTR